MKIFLLLLAGFTWNMAAATPTQPTFYSIVQLDTQTFVQTSHETMQQCTAHLDELEALGAHTLGCHTYDQLGHTPGCIVTERNVLSMQPVSLAFVYECIR